MNVKCCSGHFNSLFKRQKQRKEIQNQISTLRESFPTQDVTNTWKIFQQCLAV